MNKLMISAAAAAALVGSAFTFGAIAAPNAPEEPGQHMQGERGFLFDAKIDGMKAALKLTPEQEKLWPAFETAVRDARKARMEAMRARREAMEKGERPSPIAMMDAMSDHLAKASEEVKKVADAAKPLYDSLDQDQKQRFGPLLMMLRDQGQHRWDRREHAGPKPL